MRKLRIIADDNGVFCGSYASRGLSSLWCREMNAMHLREKPM
jgi:hypothetical protein